MNNLGDTLSVFLGEDRKTSTEDKKYQEVCDKDTGECYTIRTVDGIIERVDKKFITEDGRFLLKD
jgi:hypothetical protein